MDFTLKNKSEIKGTHWIEFYISEPKIKYKRWSDKSKYLEEFAHNFYTDIFDKNSRHFNYYGNTSFDKEQSIKIKEDITDRINSVDSVQTLQDLIEFGKKTSHALDLSESIREMHDAQNRQQTEILNDIKKLGYDLVTSLVICIKKDKMLWVLGL